MSRQELADACNQVITEQRATGRTGARWAGMTASHIGALERGEIRWPNSEYRRALCAVLHTTERDLGLYIDRLERASGGGTAQPSANQAGDRLDPSPELQDLRDALNRGTIGTAQLELLETVSRRLDDSYVRSSAAELAPLIREQLAGVVAHLHRSQRTDRRRRLCAVAGQLAGLQAWLMFDLARRREAKAWYAIAVTAAEEADDRALTGWLLGASSLIATQDGDHQLALRVTEQATAICTPRVDVTTHAWLTAMQARALAGVGDTAGLGRCIDRATVLAEASRPEHRRHGMDFHDNTLDVSYYAGTSRLLARDCVAADHSLTQALAGLPPIRPKARAVVALYLAESATVQRRFDEAADLVEGALDISGTQPILPILRHATQVRDHLRSARQPTGSLDERLRDFSVRLARTTAQATAS